MTVLWTASVPVLSQQSRVCDLRCRAAFLHGTEDSVFFGGHEAVLRVAKNMGLPWREYVGGHNGPPAACVLETMRSLLE